MSRYLINFILLAAVFSGCATTKSAKVEPPQAVTPHVTFFLRFTTKACDDSSNEIGGENLRHRHVYVYVRERCEKTGSWARMKYLADTRWGHIAEFKRWVALKGIKTRPTVYNDSGGFQFKLTIPHTTWASCTKVVKKGSTIFDLAGFMHGQCGSRGKAGY